ncbi:hypothetical protein GA707_20275 [Nostocoides sp. F2B08]|nr:hypothetical protein GA707_20275 [Tetrasphaera sp. F2B08]
MLDRSAEAYRPALARAFAGTRPRVLTPQGRFSDGAALLDARLPRGSRAQSSSQYCIAWTRVIEHIPPAATPGTFPMAQTLEEFDLVAVATTPVVGLSFTRRASRSRLTSVAGKLHHSAASRAENPSSLISAWSASPARRSKTRICASRSASIVTTTIPNRLRRLSRSSSRRRNRVCASSAARRAACRTLSFGIPTFPSHDRRRPCHCPNAVSLDLRVTNPPSTSATALTPARSRIAQRPPRRCSATSDPRKRRTPGPTHLLHAW